MSVTDSIFLWIIAIALIWLGVQAMGATADLNQFADHANQWLAQTRDELDIPSATEAFRQADSTFDHAMRSLASIIGGRG